MAPDWSRKDEKEFETEPRRRVGEDRSGSGSQHERRAGRASSSDVGVPGTGGRRDFEAGRWESRPRKTGAAHRRETTDDFAPRAAWSEGLGAKRDRVKEWERDTKASGGRSWDSRKRKAEGAAFDDERTMAAARAEPVGSAPPSFPNSVGGKNMRWKCDRFDRGQARLETMSRVGNDDLLWKRDMFDDDAAKPESEGIAGAKPESEGLPASKLFRGVYGWGDGPRPSCRYFERGFCHHGDNCLFEHVTVGGDGRSRAVADRWNDCGRGQAAVRAAEPARLSKKNVTSLLGERRAPRDGDLVSEASYFADRWLPKDLLQGDDIHARRRPPRAADTVSEASHFTERWLPKDLI